ncbi:MAG: hypothetical protein PUK85_05345, partial [Clostridia bacterium]|nr:hypothetical protein [Clostridia bacterium]
MIPKKRERAGCTLHCFQKKSERLYGHSGKKNQKKTENPAQTITGRHTSRHYTGAIPAEKEH